MQAPVPAMDPGPTGAPAARPAAHAAPSLPLRHGASATATATEPRPQASPVEARAAAVFPAAAALPARMRGPMHTAASASRPWRPAQRLVTASGSALRRRPRRVQRSADEYGRKSLVFCASKQEDHCRYRRPCRRGEEYDRAASVPSFWAAEPGNRRHVPRFRPESAALGTAFGQE